MKPLPTNRPPDGYVTVATWVLDSAAELRRLRGSLYEAITGRSAPPGGGLGSVPEQMVLVASELATNALEHGRPPTTVSLLRDGDDLLLEVADHDPETEPYIADEREPGQGGHGLRLSWKLAQDLAWYVDDGSKRIWARFPASSASAGVSAGTSG